MTNYLIVDEEGNATTSDEITENIRDTWECGQCVIIRLSDLKAMRESGREDNKEIWECLEKWQEPED